MTHIIGSKVLSVVINGEPHSITSDHPQFNTIRNAILNGADESEILDLFDRALAMTRYMNREIENRGGTLYYQSLPVHGLIADRILDFMAKGLPYQPLVKFMKRLLKNPDVHSVEELYRFIEQNKLPITEDGMVLGYKGVDSNYKDEWTHKIDNHVGAKPPRMKRDECDSNWRNLCSSGYHIGSYKYATDYGARTVIVAFDPADAISVPEGDAWKMRVCAYEVIGECVGQLPETVAVKKDPYRDGNKVITFLKRLFKHAGRFAPKTI